MGSRKAQVLFLLESGSQEADALTCVAALVGKSTAEVVGLFVEDTDLLGAAALPGFSEVSIRNQDVRQLDHASLQNAMTSQALQIRNLFETTARKLKLAYKFQVTQGRTIETLLGTATTKDIIIIGRPLRAPGFRARTGAQFAEFASSNKDVLFVNEPWRSGSSVIAICDDGAAKHSHLIKKAQKIAKIEGLELIIATVGYPDPTLKDADARLVQIESVSEQSLFDLCHRHDAQLLVIPHMEELNWPSLLVNLLNNLSCSLLRLG